MNTAKFLLSMIDASGRSIRGRTLLQKRAFFVSVLSGLKLNLGFDAHYYGPYSATVEGTTTELSNLGFVEESSTGFGVLSGGFEMKRYDYRLTDDGMKLVEPLRETEEYRKVRQAVEKIDGAGHTNYIELSIAAKAYFVLRKQQKPMSREDLLREAKKFSWNLKPESLERAVQFLEAMGLAERTDIPSTP